jgi:hypothetical protein
MEFATHNKKGGKRIMTKKREKGSATASGLVALARMVGTAVSATNLEFPEGKIGLALFGAISMAALGRFGVSVYRKYWGENREDMTDHGHHKTDKSHDPFPEAEI